jgi:hypothetical protein
MGENRKEVTMSRLLVRNFSISLDGYAAGPHQDLDNPLGVGGTAAPRMDLRHPQRQ